MIWVISAPRCDFLLQTYMVYTKAVKPNFISLCLFLAAFLQINNNFKLKKQKKALSTEPLQDDMVDTQINKSSQTVS